MRSSIMLIISVLAPMVQSFATAQAGSAVQPANNGQPRAYCVGGQAIFDNGQGLIGPVEGWEYEEYGVDPVNCSEGSGDNDGDNFGRNLATGLAIGAGLLILSEAARARQSEDRQAIPILPPRVAVIRATLNAVDGQFRSARLNGVSYQLTHAPQLIAQDSGNWQVLLYGTRLSDAGNGEPTLLREYGVMNPFDGLEQQAPRGSGELFERVRFTGAYDYELVVPLYDGDDQFLPTALVLADRLRDTRILFVEFEQGEVRGRIE